MPHTYCSYSLKLGKELILIRPQIELPYQKNIPNSLTYVYNVRTTVKLIFSGKRINSKLLDRRMSIVSVILIAITVFHKVIGSRSSIILKCVLH